MSRPEPDGGDRAKGHQAKRSARKPKGLPLTPPRPTPTERLDAMTREHVDSLDQERRRLLELVERHQHTIERLLPENARLIEAIGNAATNNTIATVLVAVGGGAIGYAAFVGAVDLAIASAGAGALVSGVVILVVSAIRGRRAG